MTNTTTHVTITLDYLRQRGACRDQLKNFERLFGTEVELTVELAVKHAADFDWDWASDHLLSATAWDEYNAATATAWAEYNAATAPAWAEYDAARATAWAEHNAATAPAWAEYDAARATAWATATLKHGLRR